ncbi:uncharacterized protein METZ01_LOCUS308345 [marine metagenome]|uniref:Uncharacterized protein n=1 Tax=marine metagenome TaxID=408172 RepID=A0A382N7I6_9ZZZZ
MLISIFLSREFPKNKRLIYSLDERERTVSYESSINIWMNSFFNCFLEISIAIHTVDIGFITSMQS